MTNYSINQKFLYTLIACTNIFFSCSQQIEYSKFYDLTTSDFGTSSYFICTDVKCNDSTYSIVIQNNDFFGILFRNMKTKSQDSYRTDILNSLNNNRPFVVDTSILTLLKQGYIIEKDKKLDSLLQKDKDLILKKYFVNDIFNSKTFDFPQEKRVIFSLFNKGVPCWRQCVSGYILAKDTIIH